MYRAAVLNVAMHKMKPMIPKNMGVTQCQN